MTAQTCALHPAFLCLLLQYMDVKSCTVGSSWQRGAARWQTTPKLLDRYGYANVQVYVGFGSHCDFFTYMVNSCGIALAASACSVGSC